MTFADLDNSGEVTQDEILQTQHYYPFGMVMEGNQAPQVGAENMYQFNGTEKIKDFEIDWNHTQFRTYDNALGRWHQIDPKTESFYHHGNYIGLGSNPITYTDIKGDSIPVKFYDENGRSTTTIPKVVQKMFQNEYGITIGYHNGMIYKVGDFETTLTVSADAKKEWEAVLGSGIEEQSLVFGYNLALGIKPIKGKTVLTEPVGMGAHKELSKTAFIDLADFDKDGNIRGVTTWEKKKTKFSGSDVLRSGNLARVMEHEYIGHGIKGLSDEGFFDLGAVENLLNTYREQMNLPQRDSYYYFSEDRKPGLNIFDNPTYHVTRSYQDEIIFEKYERLSMDKMVRYVTGGN